MGLAWLVAEGGETKKVSNANINLDPNFKISQALVISGYPIQGNLIIAKTDPSNKVQLNDDRIEIDESGVFVVGFNRDDIKVSLFPCPALSIVIISLPSLPVIESV